MKIVALTSVSGPYIFARYSAVASQSFHDEITLIEVGSTSITYPWQHPDKKTNYQRLVLSNQPEELQSKFKVCKNICNNLAKINPDILVIAGYARLSMLSALLWSLINKKPVVLMSESKEDDEPRIWWKEIVKSWLINKYSSALVGGYPHTKYLIKLGFPEQAIFTGYDVVDNSTFHPDTIKQLPDPLHKPFFLAINRFVQKKNLALLLSAYATYQQQQGVHAWHLVLCGDGERRSELEKQIKQYNLQNFVHLPGFLQQDELLPYFAHAQCFIHASTTEQWGLVVNEAMAAGLPVLVSNRCGCFEDLVIEGVNGFGFDPENQEQLTKLMLKMSSGEVDLEAIGQAALEHIQQYSPESFAQGLKQAIDYAMSQRSRKC
ncbi:MAG: glycosyltransferase [Snowella sp.]|nr:glycosyltransferase [Snowella sp.]